MEIAESTMSLYVILSQSNSTYFNIPQGKYEASIADPNGKEVFSQKGN